MHISLLLLASLLVLVNSESVCKLPNTGTAIFRNIDVYQKQCWNVDELALLYTRRAMAELVPRQIPHNIPIILEYIQICLITLREQVTDKKAYDYMFLALADTFGGYLQSFGLPLMHEAYYEGYVSYDNAAEFHRLQDSFKDVLMTNGEGWTDAMEVRKHINRILPLKGPTSMSSKPCSLLFTYSSCQKSEDTRSSSFIPLPVLDDNKNPNSIAVPFKNHALYNLKSRNSYDILIKYYVEASRCIAQFHDEKGIDQSEFDRVFADWLKNKVVPHLKDDVWFVAFSNVLRIVETIQQRGGIVGVSQSKEKDEGSLFSELESETQLTRTTYIIIFSIILISILLICFLYWALIKRCISCCGISCGDVESCKDLLFRHDDSDNCSLLSGLDEKVTQGSNGNTKSCGHGHSPARCNRSSFGSPSSRTQSEESRLTMSCGLGKGFVCRQHHNH